MNYLKPSSKCEIGIQLVTHIANEYSTSDLVRLARISLENGIDRVWIDDNLRFRNVFVIPVVFYIMHSS